MSQRYHSLPYRFISLRRRFHIYLRLVFFFFNDTAPTEIYPLSLPDPLPILQPLQPQIQHPPRLVLQRRDTPDALLGQATARNGARRVRIGPAELVPVKTFKLRARGSEIGRAHV